MAKRTGNTRGKERAVQRAKRAVQRAKGEPPASLNAYGWVIPRVAFVNPLKGSQIRRGSGRPRIAIASHTASHLVLESCQRIDH